MVLFGGKSRKGGRIESERSFEESVRRIVNRTKREKTHEVDEVTVRDSVTDSHTLS